MLPEEDTQEVEIEIVDDAAAVSTEEEQQAESQEIQVETSNTPETPEGVDTLSAEEREQMGQRAQKRIQKLVAQRNEAAQKAADLEARMATLETQRRESQATSQTNQLTQVKDQLSVVDSQRDTTLMALRAAKESGNIDAEISATSELQKIEARALFLTEAEKQLSQRAAAPAPKAETSPPSNPQPQAPQRLDRHQRQWLSNNEWFTEQTPQAAIMRDTALEIGDDLEAEGYDPAADAEDYYAELSSRLRQEFPALKAAARPSGGDQRVGGGGARTPQGRTGKVKIRLTQSEVDQAKRLNVSPEAYAAQKLRLQNERGE